MNIGKAIKLILKKRGMTQKELAKKTKISETSISHLMIGKTQPHQKTLKIIAKVLDVQPELLLFLSLDKDDVPVKKRPVYDAIWPQMEATFLNLFIK